MLVREWNLAFQFEPSACRSGRDAPFLRIGISNPEWNSFRPFNLKQISLLPFDFHQFQHLYEIESNGRTAYAEFSCVKTPVYQSVEEIQILFLVFQLAGDFNTFSAYCIKYCRLA